MSYSNRPDENRAYQAGETGKIRWEVLPYTQGEGLDIGCGDHKLWPSSIGIDRRGRAANMSGDVTRLKLIASESMDYVFSSHCLEDLEDTPAVLAEWWRVIKVGGNLVLYLPHAEHYPRRGTKHANPAHRHDFMPEDIVKAMQKAAPDWALRENQERTDDDEYSFLQVYTKRRPGAGQGAALEVSDPAKRCIAVRYGGYGDVLVAGSTFPHLKAEGWHLTVYTGPKGVEVLKHDPNVDRVISHDILQLRGNELKQLMSYLATRCARFVNFSGSFEGLLLADRRRDAFWWPHEMRHKHMNGNYLEAAHDVAAVPHVYRQEHYASADEITEALDWRLNMKRLVVLAARGSGVNKIWPGVVEYCWRMVTRHPDLHIAVVGELGGATLIEPETLAACPALARVHALVDSLPMRKSLALAQVADLVIGQETGLLNAVALDPMPKIVLLSHSSANNLTKHWRSTETLHGDVSCYPCHRLQGDWTGCRQDPETKHAACQAAISPMDAVRLSEALLRVELKEAA